MTLNTPLLAALFLAGSSALALAQTTSPGSSSGTSQAPRALGTSSTMTETPAPASPSTPDPANAPNAQVPHSAATLPGGGGDVPVTSSPGAETAVPLYGAKDASGPIAEAAERSQASDCDGQGSRNTLGSGTSSAQAMNRNCAEAYLGTKPIMGGSGVIDVRDTGR